MNISMYDIRQAVDQMVHHKLRTALTLLGMVFGVGAVIAMQSVGEGAERAALKMIETLGVNNIVVTAHTPEGNTQELDKLTIGLTQEDVSAVRQAYPFVTNHVVSTALSTKQIFSDTGVSDATGIGVSLNYFELSALKVTNGRGFINDDFMRFKQVAVIGPEVAAALFPNGDAVGGLLKLNYHWFEVIGVLASRTESKQKVEGVKTGGERNQVFIPMTTAQTKVRFDLSASPYTTVKFEIDSASSKTKAGEAIERILLRRHNDIKDFKITVPAELLAQHRQTQQVFNWVMSAVAGISLLVGGIGIMNIMLATVLERTQEIGLLRALGATQKDIERQFLVETLVITMVGAVIGVVFGLVLSVVISTMADWEIAFSITSVIAAVGVCSLVGLGFGIYPAKNASKLDPIEALQHA